ncbi:MAG: TRAP transporter large permease [Oscillospiraceae bacterium]
MSTAAMLSVVFLSFFALLFIGVPIGVSIGGMCIVSIMMINSSTIGMPYIYQAMYTSMDSFVLLAIPLFTLSGAIMSRGGLSKRLFDFFAYFVGGLPGGLPCAVIITCLFYGAISGSATATVMAVGSMCVPVLLDMGYNKTFSVTTVAVAGGLGVIIPPSIPFILYGNTAQVSVGDLFLGGILPGCLIAACLMIFAVWFCKFKGGENRTKVQGYYREIRSRGVFKLLKNSFFALLTPVIILGGIYGGIVTPTEAAAISVAYGLIVCLFIYRSIKLKDLWPIVKMAGVSIAPTVYIIAVAGAFGRCMSFMGGQDFVANMFIGIGSKTATLLAITAFLLILGMVMDVGPAILILAPVFNSIAVSLGMDPVHMGVFVVCALSVGFVTPPVGVSLYVATSLPGQVPFLKIAKQAVPYIVFFIIAILIIAFIPAISTVFI